MARIRVVGRAWAALAAAAALAGCGGGAGSRAEAARQLTGGDPGRGRGLVASYGCDACHTIPGVPGADSRVGPPLVGLAGRIYLAGRLPNTPDNLVRWIRDPAGVDPMTAMPDVGASAEDARDMAAYLYSVE